jgi:hypothetical protein
MNHTIIFLAASLFSVTIGAGFCLPEEATPYKLDLSYWLSQRK